MRPTAAPRQAKLATLMEIEGYKTVEQLAEAILSDSVSPAICINDGCDYTAEMEPDQDAGFCEACRTNSMVPGAAQSPSLRDKGSKLECDKCSVMEVASVGPLVCIRDSGLASSWWQHGMGCRFAFSHRSGHC